MGENTLCYVFGCGFILSGCVVVKYLVVAFFALLPIYSWCSQGSRWEQVATSDEGAVYYIDMATVRVTNGSSLKFWSQVVFPPVRKRPKGYVASAVVVKGNYQIEIDCEAEKARVVSWSNFDNRGRSVDYGNGGGEFEPIAPETIREFMKIRVCPLSAEKLE